MMKRIFQMTIVLLFVAALSAMPLISQDCKATCKSKTCDVKAEKKVEALVCPVCKMKIEDKAKAVKLEHEGKTLYFMSEGCKEAFLKEPAKYLQACCADKVCYKCAKCGHESHEAGKCPKCSVEMKKMEAVEKAACCQAKTDCEKKVEKK